MKNINLLFKLLIILCLLPSCQKEEEQISNLRSQNKKKYLPIEAKVYRENQFINYFEFKYDSLNRIVNISHRDKDDSYYYGYGFYYNSLSLITKILFNSDTQIKVYYTLNEKIKELYWFQTDELVNYSFNPSSNRYDSDSNNDFILLDHEDDVIDRSRGSYNYSYDYTNIKGPFHDLKKQPYFIFFEMDHLVSQSMSKKAYKSIESNGQILYSCSYVLNPYGYPSEVIYKAQDGKELKVIYYYKEI